MGLRDGGDLVEDVGHEVLTEASDVVGDSATACLKLSAVQRLAEKQGTSKLLNSFTIQVNTGSS